MANESPIISAIRNVLLVFMGCLTLGFPVWLFSDSLWNAYHQDRMIKSFAPVDAKVLSSQVTSEQTRHSTHYHMEARYQYVVAGQAYISDQVTAVEIWGSGDWANDLVSKYKAGSACKAYYNPEKPGEAILLRIHSFGPYLDMLGGALMLAMGIFAFKLVRSDKARPPTQSERGGYEITAKFSERERFLTAIYSTVCWYGLGGIAAAHYFLILPWPHPTPRVTIFAFFGLAGLIPLGLLIRRWRINRNLGDARLLVKQAVTQAGKPLVITISQPVRLELHVRSATARVVCYGKKDKSRRSIFERTVIVIKDRMMRQGETLELSADADLPADSQPSGRCQTGQFSWINWELQYELRYSNGPRYQVVFPIEMEAGPVDQPEPVPVPKTRARADIRPIEAGSEGRILSKGNITMVYLIALATTAIQFAGVALFVCAMMTLFPSETNPKPFQNLPKPEVEIIMVVGAVLAVVTTFFGLVCPNRLSGAYLLAKAKHILRNRRDAIVQPEQDSLWVDIIPRTNWNRLMLENATDAGFIRVDTARREILFEGDRERYRVPADAVISCELAWMGYAQNGNPKASRFCLVVLRANGPNGLWEAPIMPRIYKHRAGRSTRTKAAEALQSKIREILPRRD
jgi:hypothetical protein